MSDLKSFWTNPAMPTDTGLSGSGVLSSGGDPNADGNPGPNALQSLWDNAPGPTDHHKESANSVSGLPPAPTRWEPSGTPPAPPSLKDRNPGTIDER